MGAVSGNRQKRAEYIGRAEEGNAVFPSKKRQKVQAEKVPVRLVLFLTLLGGRTLFST